MQSPCASYSWKASQWSACSVQCGGGTATRDVSCYGSDGIKRTDETCAAQGTKPEGSKACNTLACEKYEFAIGEWEDCSVATCGGGTQSRSLKCLSSTTQQSVELTKCAAEGEAIPPAQRACNTAPCLSFYWQLGAFGSCDATCNGGLQTRSVQCLGSDGAKYRDDFCLTFAPKATTQQAWSVAHELHCSSFSTIPHRPRDTCSPALYSCPCCSVSVCFCSNTRPCGTFSWTPEATFSSCSVSCDRCTAWVPTATAGPTPCATTPRCSSEPSRLRPCRSATRSHA